MQKVAGWFGFQLRFIFHTAQIPRSHTELRVCCELFKVERLRKMSFVMETFKNFVEIKCNVISCHF